MIREKKDTATSWREKAIEILKSRPGGKLRMDAEEFEKTVAELRIHQVELELQNEELRKAQIEMEKQRDRYSRLYNQAPVGYMAVDDSGIVLDANQTLADMIGQSVSEIRYVPFSRLVHPEDRKIFFSTFKNFIRHSGRRKIELRLSRREGDFFHARLEARSASLGSIYDKGENPFSGRLVAISDITDRKIAENELRDSRERLVKILESVSDGFLALDKDLHVACFNKAAEKILKRDARTFVGRNLFDAFPEAKGSVFERKALEAFQKKRAVSFETYFDKPPYQNWYEARIFPYQDGVSIFFRVTTERKDLEAQLRQSRKMEAIGTLAGGIAHDFNNILGIILGNIELVLDDPNPDARFRGHMDEIRTASLRAREVVRQLLSFSRSREEERKPVDIVPVVRESLKLLRVSIPANIKIRENIQSAAAHVCADPTQIHQVLINLCTNACHAVPEIDGEIEVRLETVHVRDEDAAGPQARLEVIDNGSGISEEHLERIFDPYFTTKEIGKGTGMGLSVVHGIVKNHGGQISVKSRLGEGSAFTVLLPLVETAGDKMPSAGENIVRGSESVLFIDDEPALARMGKAILERFGYRAEALTDPLEALELVRRDPGRYDLIVSDTAMPSMRGDMLAREVLGIRPDQPFILCTGYSDQVDGKRAAEIGIRCYLEKPLSIRTLLGAVRKALDRKKKDLRENPE